MRTALCTFDSKTLLRSMKKKAVNFIALSSNSERMIRKGGVYRTFGFSLRTSRMMPIACETLLS